MPRGGARPGAGRKKRSESQVIAAAQGVAPLNPAPPQNKPPAVGRTANGKFAPGHSGNPGGRPKGERAFLVEKYGNDARVLHEELDKLRRHKKTPPHVKKDILQFQIERHSGKATQPLSGPNGDDIPVTSIINNYVAPPPAPDGATAR